MLPSIFFFFLSQEKKIRKNEDLKVCLFFPLPFYSELRGKKSYSRLYWTVFRRAILLENLLIRFPLKIVFSLAHVFHVFAIFFYAWVIFRETEDGFWNSFLLLTLCSFEIGGRAFGCWARITWTQLGTEF